MNADIINEFMNGTIRLDGSDDISNKFHQLVKYIADNFNNATAFTIPQFNYIQDLIEMNPNITIKNNSLADHLSNTLRHCFKYVTTREDLLRELRPSSIRRFTSLEKKMIMNNPNVSNLLKQELVEYILSDVSPINSQNGGSFSSAKKQISEVNLFNSTMVSRTVASDQLRKGKSSPTIRKRTSILTKLNRGNTDSEMQLSLEMSTENNSMTGGAQDMQQLSIQFPSTEKSSMDGGDVSIEEIQQYVELINKAKTLDFNDVKVASDLVVDQETTIPHQCFESYIENANDNVNEVCMNFGFDNPDLEYAFDGIFHIDNIDDTDSLLLKCKNIYVFIVHFAKRIADKIDGYTPIMQHRAYTVLEEFSKRYFVFTNDCMKRHTITTDKLVNKIANLLELYDVVNQKHMNIGTGIEDLKELYQKVVSLVEENIGITETWGKFKDNADIDVDKLNEMSFSVDTLKKSLSELVIEYQKLLVNEKEIGSRMNENQSPYSQDSDISDLINKLK